MVHPPKHWFHMVLETRYKHLRHQMKSASECSKRVHLRNNARSEWCWMQIWPRLQRATASRAVVIRCRCVSEQQLLWIWPSRCEAAHSSCAQRRGVLTFATAKPVTGRRFLFLSCLFNRCASWRSKSCFCKDGVRKPVPVSWYSTHLQVRGHTRVLCLHVHRGNSEVSINTSVRKRRKNKTPPLRC